MHPGSEAELATLSENLLAGVVGPTISCMIADREAERQELLDRQATLRSARPADVLPHPVVIRRFEEKIAKLREALTDPVERDAATATVRSLIERVTVHCDSCGSVEADLAASAGRLLSFAQNEESPCRGSGRGFL